MIQRFFLLLFSLFLYPLIAEERQVLELERFNFVFENDTFVRTDRWYTAGIDLSTLFKLNNDPFYLPFADRGTSVSYFALAITLEMYSPEEFNNPEPQYDDRPYAGWAYASFALHQSSAERLDSLELQLGLVGPSAKAEEIQRFTHDYILGDAVDGWQNQLHDEFGINLAYHHHERYLVDTKQYEAVLIPRIGGVLGTVRTEFDLGLLYRIGIHVPRDFGQNFVMMPGLDSGIPALDKNKEKYRAAFSYYLQLQSDLRFIGKDLFLEGNTNKSSLSVEPYPLVGRVGGGVGGSYENYTLSLVYTAESRSFTQQPHLHGYASLLFSYLY
ncbi:lipid A deacylase LpxR family protein [Sulfurimonas sp. HSL3-7]|uniref:lipid A deacylase LpxR family protein n=1 Tax=Sulfonitrofixus jiaomeiensis TaxID=3131938 RepID=UPI0031F7528C